MVERLRELGHDVLTTEEAGLSDQEISDEEVLRFATSENRTVFSLNRRHFITLHRHQPNHAGIIVCTFDRNFAAQAERIHEAISGRERIAGALLRVNRPG